MLYSRPSRENDCDEEEATPRAQISSKGIYMYSTKSLSGTPAIQHNGINVLSVWNKDWTFAFELCELLNELEDHQPELLLSDSDRKWLKKMDRAFKGKVQHA
jgi:hypothetical protein